jgi:hypothetical protein
MLNRGGHRLRLLPGVDLPPPLRIGGKDPFTAAKELADRDTTIQWPSWQATHQLRVRPSVSPPPLHRSLSSKVCPATAPNHD